MQSVSEQYKTSMSQIIRNRSNLLVSIGDVNPTAQMSAQAKTSSYRAYFSDVDSVFSNGANADYSTLEEDFTPADGSMLFVPRQNSGLPYMNTGYVSRGFMQSTNNQDCYFVGYFDKVYRSASDETPFRVTIEFADGSSADTCSIYLRWDGASWYGWSSVNVVNNKVTITSTSIPSGMSYIDGLWIVPRYSTDDYRRARIKNVVFGNGVCIFPDIIENTEQKSYISKIDENLPTSELTVNLINFDARYDADNPDNPLKIFDDNKQEINIYYGYDIDGNGTWEWVHGGTFVSDSWSSGKHKATIMAKDILQSNENLFIHSNSALGENNNAEYWLQMIMGQLGITEYEYDPDMANITMELPFAHTISAKEVLQQLANYCCKTLYIDNEGKVRITSATNITNENVEHTEDITVTSSSYTKTIEGTLSRVYDSVIARVVISGARVYSEAVSVSGDDYSYTFTPRYGNGTYRVSIVGLYEGTMPDFEITSNDIIDDIDVEKEELIKEVVVPFYSYAFVPTEEVILTDEIVEVPSDNYLYTQSFGDTIYGFVSVEVDKYPFMATESNLTQYSNSLLITPNELVSYGTSYMVSVDTANRIHEILEYDSNNIRINIISVNNYSYLYTPTNANVVKAAVTVKNQSGTAIVPSDVYEFYMAENVALLGYPDEPLDYWYMYLDEGTYKVKINSTGYFKFTSANVKYQINNSGKSLKWDNPLIGSQERALLVAQYVGDYLQSNIKYNYQYRGNPELNANDVIRQENDFISNMQVVISEHKIGFNGALSGEITARRRIAEG